MSGWKTRSLRYSTFCSEILTRAFVRSISLVCLLSAIFCITVSYTVTCMYESTDHGLLAEQGPVEMTTVVVYGVVVLSLLTIGLTRRISVWSADRWKVVDRPRYPFLLAIFVAIFAARELDFHSRWTSIDVLKTSFYISADIGLIEKGIVLTILSAIVVVTLSVVLRYKEWVYDQCRLGKLDGIFPLVGVGLVIVSKGLDSGVGTLRRAGVAFSDTTQLFLHAMEEFSELLIPFIFVAILIRSVWKRSVASDVRENAVDTETAMEAPRRMAA